MTDLRDRAAAIGVELHELRRQAALANDVAALQPLKECDRALKRAFGRGDGETSDAYTELKERLIEQAYRADLAEERVIQKRIESLTANVRSEVLAQHAGRFQAREDQLADREAAVTAREREATPSYRAALIAVGAVLAVAGDWSPR